MPSEQSTTRIALTAAFILGWVSRGYLEAKYDE